MGVDEPYEVVSSEDMLSRIHACNEKLEKMKNENTEDWEWTEDLILIGTDVKSLFPSLSAERTGKAVRAQFEKTKVVWENIDWRLLTLYVKLHEYYWKEDELKPIQAYLPIRKNNIGRPPSIGTIDVEHRFSWPQIVDYIGKDAKRLLMGLAMEVAVVFFFNNFTYTFANEIFLQMFGGPIGARLTMAVARLVMQTWKEEYNKILLDSQIQEFLSGLYVDDGRSLHRKLFLGERYDPKLRKFVVSEDMKKVDIESGITRDEITRKEILIAMNSVNHDLNFTMELCGDFVDGRLPTLSFSIWPGKDKIEHSYFEKSMKNQTLLMARTSMCRHQILNIMSNELIRRLEMVDKVISQNEKNEIVNKYVQQLVNSEYSWKMCREIVVSGLIGFVRKMKRKVNNDIPTYRSNKYSLRDRVNKKLTEKYNWFKSRKKNESNDKDENIKDENMMKDENRIKVMNWKHYKGRKEPIEALERVDTKKDIPPPSSAICPIYRKW